MNELILSEPLHRLIDQPFFSDVARVLESASLNSSPHRGRRSPTVQVATRSWGPSTGSFRGAPAFTLALKSKLSKH